MNTIKNKSSHLNPAAISCTSIAAANRPVAYVCNGSGDFSAQLYNLCTSASLVG